MKKQIPLPVILVLAVAAPLGFAGWLAYAGGPVPGEAEMAAQIERENRSLCGKFGFVAGTRQAVDCGTELTNLRKNHEKLIASRWF